MVSYIMRHSVFLYNSFQFFIHISKLHTSSYVKHDIVSEYNSDNLTTIISQITEHLIFCVFQNHFRLILLLR